jgi:CBS domain-containing membrane protein
MSSARHRRAATRFMEAVRGLGLATAFPKPKELILASIGAACGIAACAMLAMAAPQYSTLAFMLIAPMGATAVLLFAVPNSPLAQPWSAIVGNSVAALAGLGVVALVESPSMAAPASVGLAILGMLATRSLHPPGGAVALTAALNAEQVRALGMEFVIGPVMLGSAMLVAAAWLWSRVSGRIRSVSRAAQARRRPP